MRPSTTLLARIAIAFTAVLALTSNAPAEKVIYSFQKNGIDGYAPYSRLLESHGKLYGVTSAGGANGTGAVIELTPPVPPSTDWTEAVIYSFTSNGERASRRELSGGEIRGSSSGLSIQDPFPLPLPTAGLIRDSNGVLYGSNCTGGVNGHGEIFELLPPVPPSTTWTESVIYSFTQKKRGYCPSELSIGPDGQFYGTTAYGGTKDLGTVFKLAKQPDGSWQQVVLYRFASESEGKTPMGGVISDAAGNLYGTTYRGGGQAGCRFTCGTVFEVQPPVNPGDPWTETLLHSFDSSGGGRPVGALIRDSQGNLFGTTAGGQLRYGGHGGGSVFQLTPPAVPGGSWTFSTLTPVSFNEHVDGDEPTAGVVLDEGGNLYGTMSHGAKNEVGTAFQLAPPAQPGDPWTFTLLHTFLGFNVVLDGGNPYGALIFGPYGALYGTTKRGGAYDGGTVFQIAP